MPRFSQDLVQRLLVLDPNERLGSDSQGGIEGIKAHPFFEGIVWETLGEQTPPKLDPFLPAISPDDKPLHAHDVRLWVNTPGNAPRPLVPPTHVLPFSHVLSSLYGFPLNVQVADDELADIEAAIFMKSMGEIEVVSKEDKARQEKLTAQKQTPWCVLFLRVVSASLFHVKGQTKILSSIPPNIG